jgi:hypothetical protein
MIGIIFLRQPPGAIPAAFFLKARVAKGPQFQQGKQEGKKCSFPAFLLS